MAIDKEKAKRECEAYAEKKRIEKSGKISRLDFDKLINAITAAVPQKYKDNPVTTCYLDVDLFISRMAWSNRTNKMISYFAYAYSIDDEYVRYSSKGEEYIIEVLYAINERRDYASIAPLFLYVFLREFGGYLKMDDDTYYVLLMLAKNLIKREGYPLPHQACKEFLPISSSNLPEQMYKRIKECEFTDETEFAGFIVSLIDTLLSNYQLRYYTYPELTVEQEIKMTLRCKQLLEDGF